MEWTQLFTIALGAILVNNFIVAQFLGICPFMAWPPPSVGPSMSSFWFPWA